MPKLKRKTTEYEDLFADLEPDLEPYKPDSFSEIWDSFNEDTAKYYLSYVLDNEIEIVTTGEDVGQEGEEALRKAVQHMTGQAMTEIRAWYILNGNRYELDINAELAMRHEFMVEIMKHYQCPICGVTRSYKPGHIFNTQTDKWECHSTEPRRKLVRRGHR